MSRQGPRESNFRLRMGAEQTVREPRTTGAISSRHSLLVTNLTFHPGLRLPRCLHILLAPETKQAGQM